MRVPAFFAGIVMAVQAAVKPLYGLAPFGARTDVKEDLNKPPPVCPVVRWSVMHAPGARQRSILNVPTRSVRGML